MDVSPNWQRLQREIKSNKHTNSNKEKNKNGRLKIDKKTNGKCNNEKAKKAKTSDTLQEIWFDNVDPCLIKSSMIASSTVQPETKLCKETSFDGFTRYVAMDCEMVGTGFDGRNSALARVSIVNLYGHCIYDKYVKPVEEVTDYRTEVSGIRPENLVSAHDFKTVQNEVFDIIRNRILVGHAIQHDLKVLFLSQPKNMIRDTSVYFRKFFNNRTPSLKKLTEVYLGVNIQDGEHNSVTDAQATMRLYTLFKKKWETSIKQRNNKQKAYKRKVTNSSDETAIRSS